MHSVIILFFIFLLTFYTTFKFKDTLNFNKYLNKYYNAFSIIIDRYSNLYYYFNNLKLLIILSDKDKRWNYFVNIMENMIQNTEELERKYNGILSENKKGFKEVKKLFEILTYNKNDSLEYIKENICKNETLCQNYLNNTDNIFISGIDTAYRTCINYLNNIFMDYKNIENKSNINEIISSISDINFHELKELKESFTNVFFFLKENIYNYFQRDEINFRNKFKKGISLLNIFSMIYSILIFLYVITFVFISISNYIGPIKDSTYRIKNSIYNIEKYNIYNNRKKNN